MDAVYDRRNSPANEVSNRAIWTSVKPTLSPVTCLQQTSMATKTKTATRDVHRAIADRENSATRIAAAETAYVPR